MTRKWKTTQIVMQTLRRHLLWSSSPQYRASRVRVENITKMNPGPTQYATSCVDDIKSSFQHFLPESIEGKRVFEDTWKEIDLVDLQAYTGLLILAGVYRSNNEATKSLWDAESGWPIFRATMSLQQLHIFSRIIWFHNRDTRPGHWKNDKLATIWNIWDRWVLAPATYVQSRPWGDSWWEPGSFQRSLFLQSVHYFLTREMWYKDLGSMWHQEQLCLEYAVMHAVLFRGRVSRADFS